MDQKDHLSRSLRRWFELPALFWLIAAVSIGIWIRLEWHTPMQSFFATSDLIHAHTHAALLGWVYLVMSGFTLRHFINESTASRVLRPMSAGLQIANAGMLVSFALQGYAFWSILFSSLHLFLMLWLAGLYVMRPPSEPDKSLSRKFASAAWFWQVVSGFGPIILAATGGMDGYDALAEVLELVRAFEDRGPICELHEEAMPDLEGLGCDLCVRGANPELRTERAVLDDVREAARVLSTSPGVAATVPNVGTNVGTALPDADDVADVAAIPGRIYERSGRVEVPANPEFGASEHVATTILAAMAVDGSRRGAVNLVTDDALLDVAKSLPEDPEDYVHRIGRTGRAGAKGVSISFVGEEDAFSLPEIERYIGDKLPCEHPPEGLL